MKRKTRNGARHRNRRRNHHHNNPLSTTQGAAAVVYGAVQIKVVSTEKTGEHTGIEPRRAGRKHHFGGLDAIPVVGAVGKGVKAFKGTSELADLAKLLKFKEGMPGFNPNLGKNGTIA